MSDLTDAGALPLREVIRGLRNEIAAAAADAQGSKLKFALGSIELEFHVVATREGDGKGGISFGILGVHANLEAGGKIATERTQRVKFTLTPEMETASGLREPAEIRSRPKVAGRE